jgi:hypothetical protein
MIYRHEREQERVYAIIERGPDYRPDPSRAQLDNEAVFHNSCEANATRRFTEHRLDDDVRSTIVHEVQHALDRIEIPSRTNTLSTSVAPSAAHPRSRRGRAVAPLSEFMGRGCAKQPHHSNA